MVNGRANERKGRRNSEGDGKCSQNFTMERRTALGESKRKDRSQTEEITAREKEKGRWIARNDEDRMLNEERGSYSN